MKTEDPYEPFMERTHFIWQKSPTMSSIVGRPPIKPIYSNISYSHMKTETLYEV